MENNTKARQQAYYQQNREKIRAYYRERYPKKKDSEPLNQRIKLTTAVYRARNKQYISEQA